MKILVAPLDWGLGHATRCIPIIRYLLEKKCEVIVGADGRPLQLLQEEFPMLDFVVMPGYDVSYPKSGSMLLKISAQIPKFLLGIKREHELLKKIIAEKKIDAVISDNRFGLWNKKTPCVFITHQIMVKSPYGEKLIHRLNKFFISKYSECWIPDYAGKNNLSGDLSHKFSIPENAKYIGPLSRFYDYKFHKRLALTENLISKNKNDILVILSGPEPQRTIFEKKILEQLTSSHLTPTIRHSPQRVPAQSGSSFGERPLANSEFSPYGRTFALRTNFRLRRTFGGSARGGSVLWQTSPEIPLNPPLIRGRTAIPPTPLYKGENEEGQKKEKDKNVLIVQGITEKNERKRISENVEIVSHLTSEELLREILSSEIILSRSGYSTIMDLAVLGKKAIFVPTPGQTEQEYLAKYLSEKKIAYFVSQKRFDLKVAIEESKKYEGWAEKYYGEEYKKAIDKFLC